MLRYQYILSDLPISQVKLESGVAIKCEQFDWDCSNDQETEVEQLRAVSEDMTVDIKDILHECSSDKPELVTFIDIKKEMVITINKSEEIITENFEQDNIL